MEKNNFNSKLAEKFIIELIKKIEQKNNVKIRYELKKIEAN